MKLAPHQIILLLDRLGISHKTKPNAKGWLPIVCPACDKPFGHASVNLNNGAISCFACKYVGNINSFMQEQDIIIERATAKKVVIPEPPEPIQYETPDDYEFTHIKLCPDKYDYTRQRGFTQEFCDMFNIRLCVSGFYSDYMIIPVKDKKKNINEFEARKIKEYEVLQDYYKSKESFEILKEKLKLDKKGDKLDMDYYMMPYLLKSKVLYASGSRLAQTLWNIDNLNFNKPLYVVEGMGSIPKIYMNISKNVTCTFGSKVIDPQYEYLRLFKKVILIPDNDEAGDIMIQQMQTKLDNLYTCRIKSEDTDPLFIEEIKKTAHKKPECFINKTHWESKSKKSKKK